MLIPNGLVAQILEDPLHGGVCFLVIHFFRGNGRNKQLSPNHQQKLNIDPGHLLQLRLCG